MLTLKLVRFQRSRGHVFMQQFLQCDIKNIKLLHRVARNSEFGENQELQVTFYSPKEPGIMHEFQK